MSEVVDPAVPRGPRWAFVASVLLVAAALRFTGLSFGLPLAEARPDELTIAFQAMKFGTGDLNPHSFNYPSLHKYVSFGLFGAWYVYGKLTGLFAGQEDFLRSFFDGAVWFRWWMRAWSAGMGVAGVALLLRFPHGGLAAALLSVAFLHVRDSHFGVTDVTMVTLATAGVLAAHGLLRRGRTRDALLAGLWCGLATSTKYNAALTAIPLAAAALSSPVGGAPRLRLLGFAGLAMGAAFVLGTPYALLDSATFYRDFQYEAHHLLAGHYVDVGGGWAHHLQTLALTQGELFLLVAGAGLLLAFRLEPREALVLYSFPVAYYVAIGRGETAFFRYVLPVLPFLCLAAARALAVLHPRPLVLVGLLLLGMEPLARSVAAVRLLQAGDTRDAMGRWIEANVPTEAEILHAGAYTGAPMLQRNVANQTREYEAKAGRADAAGFRKPDDERWYNHDRPRYDVWFVAKEGIDFASQHSVAEVLAAPPPWLMIEESPLVHYSAVPEPIEALARTKYRQVHEERATTGPTDGPVYDQQDALYLPAGGFDGYARMGPTLRLYERRDE